jgi:hypothetical protein
MNFDYIGEFKFTSGSEKFLIGFSEPTLINDPLLEEEVGNTY